MKQLLFFISISFWLLTSPLWAQEPVSIHLTADDGLPDVEFYTLIDDVDGNIWFGANNGLYKYDGKEYKEYTNPKKRGRSVFGLKLDPQGRLWCNNIAGQFFYIEHDQLILFEDFQDDLKGVLYDFNFINNHFIISTSASYIIVNMVTMKKQVIEKGQGVSFNPVVIEDQVYLFDNAFNYTIYDNTITPKNKVDTHLSKRFHRDLKLYVKTFKIDSYFILMVVDQLKNENIFFKVKDDSIQEITVPASFNNLRIENIHKYNNHLYVASINGLFITTFENDVITISDQYLKEEFITKSIHDSELNLWCTTLNNGVFVIPSETLKTYNQFNKPVARLEVKNDSVCFLGGENGFLATLNINSGIINTIENKSKTDITALHYNAEKDRLIINSKNKSQVLEKGKLSTINLGAAAKSITAINNKEYLTSYYAFSKVYNIETKESFEFNDSRSFKSIYVKETKKSYLCNVNGLLVYDEHFKNIQNIYFKNGPIYALDITKTEDGTIWVATFDKGILKIKDDIVIKQISVQNGLSSNKPNSIKADGTNLWIATDGGLQNYNTQTGTIQSITKRDGIPSFNVKDMKILGNTVLLANNDGLYSFDKRTVFKDRNIPKPYFTSITIQERDTLIQPSYTIAQEESEIRFNFNTRGFKSTMFTKYQYQLSGFDEQWIDVEQGIHNVKFNTLPAGNYTFNLKAKNKFESKFSTPITIDLIIILPFYKSWWFLAIVFLIIALLLYVYFNFEKRRLKNQQKIALEKSELSKELVFSQLENLRSQMNPHFIFNALNSIQDYIILNEGKMARAYLVKFSSLMRKYLDHSQKNEVTLAEEIEALNLYLELEKDRFEGSFSYKVLIDPELDLKHTTVPSLLIQPYVENALKHGLMHKKEDKSLLLKFEKNKNPSQLICIIEDNGIGRDASLVINKNRYKNHTSFASKANQKRIDLLNQARDTKLELTIDDLYNGTQPKGTRVTIKMPLYEE